MCGRAPACCRLSYASDYREIASRLKSEIADQTALNPATNWYGIALAQSLLGDFDAAAALATSRKLFEGEEANEAVAAAQVAQQRKAVDAAPKAVPATPKPAARGSSSLSLSNPDAFAHAPDAAPSIALPPVHVRDSAPAPVPAATARESAQTPSSLPSQRQPRSTPSLDVLAADIARKAGRFNDAIRLAAIAEQRWPDSHAAIDVHIQALARRETRAELNRGDWWLYLAQASAGLKDTFAQHQAMAEKFAIDGAWPSAIRQLKEARDIKSAGFYDLSTISARLRDFEARYKEEREEEKKS